MNSYILQKILCLIIGGVTGSLVTAHVMKSKYEPLIEDLNDDIDRYEKHMDKEVEKVKKAIIEGYGKDETDSFEDDEETFNDRDDDREKLEKIGKHIANQVKKAKEKPDMNSLIKENGYRNEDEFDDEEDDDDPDRNEVPEDDSFPPEEYEDIQIITEEEFGEYRDYDKEYFFYLRDKTLVDDQGNMIEDVDDIVGYDSLHQFNDIDDDHVFVRNFRMKTDIDIYRDMDHTINNFRNS